MGAHRPFTGNGGSPPILSVTECLAPILTDNGGSPLTTHSLCHWMLSPHSHWQWGLTTHVQCHWVLTRPFLWSGKISLYWSCCTLILNSSLLFLLQTYQLFSRNLIFRSSILLIQTLHFSSSKKRIISQIVHNIFMYRLLPEPMYFGSDVESCASSLKCIVSQTKWTIASYITYLLHCYYIPNVFQPPIALTQLVRIHLSIGHLRISSIQPYHHCQWQHQSAAPLLVSSASTTPINWREYNYHHGKE
jgi:uncharacterized membrane protein (GlpM family)